MDLVLLRTDERAFVLVLLAVISSLSSSVRYSTHHVRVDLDITVVAQLKGVPFTAKISGILGPGGSMFAATYL